MLDYKTMSLDDIIAWCKANDQVAWLKATAAKKVDCEVYPRIKIAKVDAEGNPVLNAKGKPVMVSVADKSQKPKKVKQPISFIQLKQEFVDMFMAEIKPSKKDKPSSMYDRIKNL